MKGFLAGVLVTALIGGLLMHLSSRYDTLNACTAAERGLTAGVVASLRTDVNQRIGNDLPKGLPQGLISDMVMQPLAEPLVRERVRAYLADRGWFGCGWLVVRLDFLDSGSLIADLRSLTLRF